MLKSHLNELITRKDKLESGAVAAARVFSLEKQANGELRRIAIDPEEHRKKVAAAHKAKRL